MFSRLYAWLAGALGLIAFMASVYFKGKKDARLSQVEDENKRLRNAVEADARGRERIARGELLNDDGFRRD